MSPTVSSTPPSPADHGTLPEGGAGSLAPLGRRIVALFTDWFCSVAIAIAFLGYHLGSGGGITFRPLLVFAVMQIVLVSTVGTSLGHRLMGLRVQRMDGRAPGFRAGCIRTALLCLGIPPVVWDRTGRGLHDILAGTIIVRSR